MKKQSTQKRLSKESREVIRKLENRIREINKLEKDWKQLESRYPSGYFCDTPLFSFFRQLH